MKKIVFFFLIAFLLNLTSYSQTIISSSGDGGFETAGTLNGNGWTVANDGGGGSRNRWFVGNPTGVGATGSRAAYISSDGGATYGYNNGRASISHFYRDVVIPAGVSQVTLSFNWKTTGESDYDYLSVYLVPATTTVTGGTAITTGQLGGELSGQSTYQSFSTSLPCSVRGTTHRLIFSWRNDGSDGSTPAGAIDNISLVATTAVGCSLGTGVTNVASLPYNSGTGTTAGAGNDLTASNVFQICGSSDYYTGEDRVWIFTPTVSGQITIDLASSGSFTGLMLYDTCPINSCTANCVAQTQSSTGNKSLCTNVVAGTTYYLILDSFSAPSSNAYTNLSISAPVPSSAICSLGGTYTVSSITHSPDVLTSSNLSGFRDDIFYPGGVVATGFDFCFNGNQYQDFLISANGYIIFAPPTSTCEATNLPGNTNATAGGYSDYEIDANIPNTTNAPRNAILAWHDIDPSITSGGATPVIRYQTFGTAPNRRFVVSWENVAMFSSSCNGDRTLDYTGQIKMFETSNNIEIHMTRKRLCPTWNDGNAVVGLHNFNGTQAVVPTNRNALDANWTATNEAYRFTFNASSCTTCTPLPLNLMFFNGEWNKQTLEAELKWAFKDQKDAEMYILEHSTDEVNFKEIAQISVKDVNVYAYTHKQPSKGRNFYRIQKVIKNKKSEYSHQVTVINPIAESWQVESVYPNPTNTFSTKLDINSLDKQEMIIKIVNLQGVEQFSQKRILDKGHNTLEVDLKKVAKGTYLLVVNTATQIETRRIVIE
ncbi:MAG: T9SS type A sorting domain-containing protein [Raineya sp.]|nr:T9SS type A sorting domain-containing protein [Raineya sp.]